MDRELLKKLGNARQLGGITEYTLTGGAAHGMRMVSVSNGAMEIELSASRCLDITSFTYKGINLGFISKNGYVDVTQSYTSARSFAASFPGGFLYTCGLDNIGVSEGYLQHGRISSCPADVVRQKTDYNGCGFDYEVQAEMTQAELFGANLSLVRTIRTSTDMPGFTLSDTVTNKGFCPAPLIALYHFNFGYPMLDEGAMLSTGGKRTEGITQKATDNIARALVMEAPSDGEEEECFYHLEAPGKASLTNSKLGLKATVEYDSQKLPVLVEWKSMASGDYALGVEPATSVFGKEKTMVMLKPGQSLTFDFRVTVEQTR